LPDPAPALIILKFELDKKLNYIYKFNDLVIKG
jgi:hypothetical protein